MHFSSNKEKEKWIEHYVERETAGARKWVEDAEAAISKKQEDTEAAANMGLTTRKPGHTFHRMMVAIGDSLSKVTSSDGGHDGQGEDDDDAEQGQLSKGDDPGVVMGTITKTVQQRMERYWQNQMKLDVLTQLGWEDAADYFSERDKQYGRSELWVPAGIQPHMDDNAGAPTATTFGELM